MELQFSLCDQNIADAFSREQAVVIEKWKGETAERSECNDERKCTNVSSSGGDREKTGA